MSKLTALEVFALELYAKGLLKGNGDEIQESLERHKQMEKEQHEETWAAAWNESAKSGHFEQYYNQTFGGES